jgi:heat-inducible transcriptional repressor
MALNERKKVILKAVIENYIETAEPVGSKTLALKSGLDVSSATIRNEMAELEDDGYLVHPHTSAGRVPSDKGYREDVDNLITLRVMTPLESEKMKEYFSEGFEEVASLLQQASSALAGNTGYTSVTLTPRLRQSQFKQLKMLMIEPGRVLMVVVLEEGVVKDRLVRITDALDESQLSRISNAIEQGLSGLPIEDITLIAVTSAGKKALISDNLLNQILYEAYVSIKQADNLSVYMEGSNKMLAYPEFRDINRARDFMDTLAQRGMVAGYLDEVNREEVNNITGLSERHKNPYMIRIGQEILLSGLQDCSFVTTTYRLGEKVVGSIGVIGPKRMQYAKVISQIDFVRNVVNDEMRKIRTGGRTEQKT